MDNEILEKLAIVRRVVQEGALGHAANSDEVRDAYRALALIDDIGNELLGIACDSCPHLLRSDRTMQMIRTVKEYPCCDCKHREDRRDYSQ